MNVKLNDDEFTLIKDDTILFAKSISNNEPNFLDIESNYKILLLCKL